MGQDFSYKLLPAHAQMIEDLLKEFVWLCSKCGWRNGILAALRTVNGSYFSDEPRDREDDVIWRVKSHDV